MPSSWLAVEAEIDPLTRARELQRSWERLLAEGALGLEDPREATAGLRPTIVESWRRSLATGLDPTELQVPIEADESEVRERWLEHPLGSLAYVLEAQLKTLAEESKSLVVVTDATGLLLNVDGADRLRERAREMSFVAGARFSEAVDGTNGIGTALAADHALQVFAFEHFNQRNHDWVCSSAPVHDPVSGRILGLIDLSSFWKAAHPRSLELVITAARTIEQCLSDDRRDRDARLRRRYRDFMTRRADLLVDRDGYVLDGAEPAHPTPFDIPVDGGELVLTDGSVAVAEPLGQGEAYLLRRPTIARNAKSAPVEALEPAEERARELATEQAALRQVATLVARESSPDQLFAAVTEQVARVFDVPLVRLLRYDRDGAEVVGGFSAGDDEPFLLRSRWSLDSPGVIASVRRTGRPARVDDYANMPGEVAATVRRTGTRSAVASPIVVAGRLWGAMVALCPRREPLPADTEARLMDFTELVATAIANVEARHKLQGMATEQKALRTAATLVASGASPTEVFAQITASAGEVFGAPFASLIRFVPDGTATMVAGCQACSSYVGMSWEMPEDDPGITRTVVKTGKPARIEDHSRVSGPLGEAARALGVGSVVGAPVVVDGAIWGVLAVGAPEDGPPLAPDVGERLAGFAELVTTTLINAEARENVRSLLNEQQTLRRVATLIAQGAGPDAILVAVCNEAAELFDTEMAAVGRFEVDEPALVTVGISAGVRGMTIGMRTELGDWLASTAVYRTGVTARRDVTAEEIPSTGPIADAVRAMGFLSTVSAPIVVEGRLWGVMTVSDSRHALAPDTERRIENFTELIATAISNREARDQVTRLLDEQSSLRRVATRVAESPVSEELFSAVAREVASVLKVSGVLVERFEPDGSVLTLGTAYDGDLEGAAAFFGVGIVMPRDPGSLAARVFDTRLTARVDDYSRLPGTIGDAARAAGLGSGVAGPILVDGELWGQMCVFSRAGTVLPVGTENRLHDFIELVATAISNYEAHAGLQRLADEQAALGRVATLVAEGAPPQDVFDAVRREVAEAFDVRYNVLWRYDPDGMATVLATARGHLGPVGRRWCIEGDTSVAARVRQTGRPARVDFTAPSHSRGLVAEAAQREGMRSGVGVPIVVEGELWGAMVVGSKKIEPLPAGLEDGLARFTELLATAIANAESREEVMQLAAEQAALRRVATLVAQGAEPRRVFAAVADEVAGIIDIPVVGVHRYEADGTFTMLGIAGETNFTVGSRWPVEEEGIGGMILATGRPARRDDYSRMPGPLGEALREDLMTSTVGVPIVVDGSIWGFMVAAAKPGKSIPPGTEDRLARFTELVATAVSNATTRTDLLTSRARVVSAADETRRRLERDLHDGIQQWLVALALKARKAAGLSAAGKSAGQELSGLADDLVAVTDELREISRGIHPAILSDAGLDDALEALARRSAIRVDLDVSFQHRYDPTLEATVYYIAAESITNAVKHAQASTVTVRGGLRGRAIELEIGDDGVGGADPRRGTGMIGLKDRVDTLGGTISFASPAGAGTTVRVKLPASSRNEAVSAAVSS